MEFWGDDHTQISPDRWVPTSRMLILKHVVEAEGKELPAHVEAQKY